MKTNLMEIFNELNDQKYWLTESGPCVIDYKEALTPLKRFKTELRNIQKKLEPPSDVNEYNVYHFINVILGEKM